MSDRLWLDRFPHGANVSQVGRAADTSAVVVFATWNAPMPIYFFNVISAGGTLEDHEGTEMPDLEHACLEAIEDARSLMSDAIRKGHDISSRRIDICNDAREVVMSVPFTDAIVRTD